MKGILFKPDMIQAIIEGRKTQTRRVIKPCSKATLSDGGQPDWVYTLAKSRYQVGETVYIKEAWKIGAWTRGNGIAIVYKGGGMKLNIPWDDWARQTIEEPDWDKWRSSLHLREKFARYFITITDVRAERLQEITYGDCIAEGLDMSDVDYIPGWDISKFKPLWNSINKDYSWESNPWVFRYEFEYKEGK